MFSWFKKLWVLISGLFIRSGESLVTSSPEAIRATYAAAVAEAKQRLKDMQQALALMMHQQKNLEKMRQQLLETRAILQQRIQGAIKKSAEDPNSLAHKQAGAKFLSAIKEINAKLEKIETNLVLYTDRLKGYESQFSSMQDEIDHLKAEEVQVLSEYISSKQIIALEERLAGVSTTSAVDESLVAIREHVERMQNEAEIASKLRVASSIDVYKQVGEEQDAVAEFEALVQATMPKQLEAAPTAPVIEMSKVREGAFVKATNTK
jgi:phage shock protein A